MTLRPCDSPPPMKPPKSPLPPLILRQVLAALLLLALLFVPPLTPAAEASLLHFEGPLPGDLGVHEGHLAPCPSPAHCAREDWAVADPAASLAALLPAVRSLEGAEVVESTGGYLHATVTSRFFGFVDDLELLADEAGGVVEARSVSRLGDSDLGVNGRRLASLRQELERRLG